jgi:uncharacterized cofD-like protein
LQLSRTFLRPYRHEQRGKLIDLIFADSRRDQGLRLVAIGGGSGLPAVLRAFKAHTTNITAVVTVADDGGSSGRLRRELGVLPPGDLRNNIAALASDESLMTQLFQYRFDSGGLQGHSFGNLFLTALAEVTGSMDRALNEAGRVLAIQGRVLPASLEDVTLVAEVRDAATGNLRRVIGESNVPASGGRIERVALEPDTARAYPAVIRAILSAELIVIGPGSLFTSIIPALLVRGVVEAIQASGAPCVYVCNIATQVGETEDFTVAGHVEAIERHIGPDVIKIVVANNAYPTRNAGPNTRYVQPAPHGHLAWLRYRIIMTDLTDPERPWRHSAEKLYTVLMRALRR